MGHELYRMIRDGHPPGWTGAMVHVAQAIADDARDPGQGPPEDGGWPWSAVPVRGHWNSSGRWRDGLTERTGLSERTISRALADLAEAGYEMREAIGTGKDGRSVFAAKGHALRFRVPRLPPRPVPERPPGTAGAGAQSPPDSGGYESRRRESPEGQSPPDSTPKPAKSASKPAILASPSPQGHPNSPPSAKSSAVNGPLEGSQGAREQDQDYSGDDGKGTCRECGQQAEVMRTMRRSVIRSHSRDHAGEPICPGTGQPPAEAGTAP
jgi:hypothetical protein